MTSEIDKLKHFHVKNKHIGNCPDWYLINIFVMVFYVILLFLK